MPRAGGSTRQATPHLRQPTLGRITSRPRTKPTPAGGGAAGSGSPRLRLPALASVRPMWSITTGSVDTWAQPFLPRIIGLATLDRLGVHAFEHLPVVAFPIPPGTPAGQTGTYAFRLARALPHATTPPTCGARRGPSPSSSAKRTSWSPPALFEPMVHAVGLMSPSRSSPISTTWRSQPTPAPFPPSSALCAGPKPAIGLVRVGRRWPAWPIRLTLGPVHK